MGNNSTPTNIQMYLAGMSFPATKSDLIKYVKDRGAPDEVLILLEELSDEETFENPNEVGEAIEDYLVNGNTEE